MTCHSASLMSDGYRGTRVRRPIPPGQQRHATARSSGSVLGGAGDRKRLRLCPVDVGEAVLAGEFANGQRLPRSFHHVVVAGERGDRAAQVLWRLIDAQVAGSDSYRGDVMRAEVAGEPEGEPGG